MNINHGAFSSTDVFQSFALNEVSLSILHRFEQNGIFVDGNNRGGHVNADLFFLKLPQFINGFSLIGGTVNPNFFIDSIN